MAISHNLPGRYSWLVVGPIATLALGQNILSHLVAVPPALIEGPKLSRLAETALRLQLITAFSLFVALTLFLAAKVAHDLYRTYGARIPAGFWVVLAIGLGLTIYVLNLPLPGTTSTTLSIDYFGDRVLFVAAEAAARISAIPPPRLGQVLAWGEGQVLALTQLYVLAVGLCATFIGIALISCCEVPSSEAPSSVRKKHWIRQSDRMRMYLYFGTATLALGVLTLKAFGSYPTFIVSPDDAGKYAALVNAFVAYQGVEYSLILATITLPIVWILSTQSDEIAARMIQEQGGLTDTPPTDRFRLDIHAKKEDEKLLLTPLEAFKVFLAILAPLITGTLSGLTGVFA